ncbi:MAG: preprotein translocase subunit SecA [Candidatus Liptonbacteria bacterium RIFCSPLOWO2_01_FULL_52_25]|uniref:Protein translocase subunit SecA n=1 Tax=Candidatus Liptonbacteria bacterium RIFCSPLOWO2_01_FULL_52_25 TaxID=1798650 RepID=A0A1G2CFS7_9BACT|nr:MAG: preprotein translocase subunit SecA [Candidatus Liptonbacteria bacterium RIFCSPLOWO2_01_FULL_52_25]
MLDSLKKIFLGDPLKPFLVKVGEINALEEGVQKLSEEELKRSSEDFRKRLAEGGTLDDILPEAFARVREAALRALNQRPFDVQLMGGLVLHQGAVAEMTTGEGKTLAAVAPTYLNALEGKGAHVVTVNEYLARRDAVWMGQIYRALGMSVSCLVPNSAYMYDPLYKTAPEEINPRSSALSPRESALLDRERDTTGSFRVQQDFLKPVSRRDAYRADVTYGTNHEFGFDYLRDNLSYSLEGRVQREHHYAIIDEVDSILIDESRTPLIIAAPDEKSSDFYKTFARVVRNLEKEEDYTVEEKHKSTAITEKGIEKVEKVLGVNNLYAPEHIRLVHYLEESIKAKALFHLDKDYVVKDGEVIIVDEFTGRMLFGRRYQGGLHQAIEAKEGVVVKEESRTYAKISVQNYFRMYKKISGMTGTAQTSAEEFHKVYKLEVVSIPTNKPLIRNDMNDLIYKNFAAKYRAVIKEVAERHAKGQPVLLGTASIEKNELLSALLGKAGVPHELLNAKNNEREGAIIAQAGRAGAVTVATNVAGRGVDIILGGNPPSSEESAKVRAVGGLHVIGTERHEARRIDNQLRGRAGRQGDPGSSQFFLSLEDDLLRIFGGDRIKSMMERFNLPEDQPLEYGFLSRVVSEAQAKVEGSTFDMRKHLLEYDDVLNKQRASVYKRRFEIISAMNKPTLTDMIFNATFAHFEQLLLQQTPEGEPLDVKKIFAEANIFSKEQIANGKEFSGDELREILQKKSEEIAGHPMAANQLLGILDMLWMTHLEDLEALSESVGLRAYGQHDPLVEYRGEAHRLFKSFWGNFNGWVFSNLFKLAQIDADRTQNNAETVQRHSALSPRNSATLPQGGKVGRNDPCPCGAKHEDGRPKKYKHCHGKNV